MKDIDGRSKDLLELLTVISDRLKAFGCNSNHSKRKTFILGTNPTNFRKNAGINLTKKY